MSKRRFVMLFEDHVEHMETSPEETRIAKLALDQLIAAHKLPKEDRPFEIVVEGDADDETTGTSGGEYGVHWDGEIDGKQFKASVYGDYYINAEETAPADPGTYTPAEGGAPPTGPEYESEVEIMRPESIFVYGDLSDTEELEIDGDAKKVSALLGRLQIESDVWDALSKLVSDHHNL